jgi:hypothetical protein
MRRREPNVGGPSSPWASRRNPNLGLADSLVAVYGMWGVDCESFLGARALQQLFELCFKFGVRCRVLDAIAGGAAEEDAALGLGAVKKKPLPGSYILQG